MDIAFPASIAIERGLDSKSKMCVAQEDIEKYYDNLVVLRVARWLEQRSDSIDLITTLVSMRVLKSSTALVSRRQLSLNVQLECSRAVVLRLLQAGSPS